MPERGVIDILKNLLSEGVDVREGGDNWGKHGHGEREAYDGRRSRRVRVRHVPRNLAHTFGWSPGDYDEDW